MRRFSIGLFVGLLFALTTGTAMAGGGNGGNSEAAHACRDGGYLELVGSGGETFRNTGECVRFAARGGTFMTPATGIVVPAGATVTFDDPTLSSCNTLSWGYTVDSITNVALGGKAFGCITATTPDVTVGPFATTVTLRVFLTDELCGSTTYYSDGDHAITTQSGPTTWDVDIADAGGFCERRTTPAVFDPPGNLSVDVVVNP